MKKIKFLGYGLFAFFALISSCKKPTEGVNTILNTNVFNATASFQFIDAKTGEQIGFDNVSEEVTVQILGDDANKVVDNSGATKIKAAKGFLSVAVENDYTPSPSNPIEFRILANAKGYLTTSVNVSFTSDGQQNHIVNMVKVDDTPKGVSAVVNSQVTTNASAVTQTTITIASPSIDTDFEPTKAEVVIPQGTKLTAKDGSNVGGTITSTLVYFNNQDETSLASFPGGFAAQTITNEDIVFKTGGFLAMEMKNQNGKEVKSFGTPIQMRMEIPADTENENGQQIQNGMTVPVWSYDTETGVWKMEELVTITKNTTTDKFEVNFEMEHLSYWNLDWYYPGSCSIGAKVTFNSNITTNSYLTAKLRYPNGQLHWSGGATNVKNGTFFNFMNAFPNTPMLLELYNNTGGCNNQSTLVSSTPISNLCTGNYTVNLNLTLPSPITVNVNASCKNKPGKIYRPSLYVYAKDISCNSNYWTYIGYMYNGTFVTSNLQQGKTYRFGVYFGGYWLEAPENFTINKSTYSYEQDMPEIICSRLN
jgi:hypothetical protein